MIPGKVEVILCEGAPIRRGGRSRDREWGLLPRHECVYVSAPHALGWRT